MEVTFGTAIPKCPALEPTARKNGVLASVKIRRALCGKFLPNARVLKYFKRKLSYASDLIQKVALFFSLTLGYLGLPTLGHIGDHR